MPHDRLKSEDVKSLVDSRLQELRKRLLDSSRRNPLINVRFSATSTSILRVVDELPDVLRHNLTTGKSMRIVPLPALEEELPDEQDDTFLEALYAARQEDELYLAEIENVDPGSEKTEGKLVKIERALKDRVREALNLPVRQTKEDLNLVRHADNHGISPSYILPMPEDENEDGRHQDTDIQTLMLPDRLTRVAKSIIDKGRSFERETGVNVFHAAFGILDWKDPAERSKFLSPLLLLEIRVDRKQSPRGAEFHVSGIERMSMNTTLMQKLQSEHGLALPEYEGGSIEDYFLLAEEAAPKGWDWKIRREVMFGIFPSSKIAMYHDLDPARRALADNEVVATMLASSGVGDGSYAETYETDDPEIARMVPHLVMDADASQYSALVDAARGDNMAIEGPPGSGKSQSIVNLIAAAMADGKKVLFVAEKLTALDVVKARLEAADIGPFILPLQAGRGTREKIYESLEERIALGRGGDSAGRDFESRQNALERRRAILQGYLDALGKPLGHTGMTVHQAIGYGISTAPMREDLPRDVRRIEISDPENLRPEDVEAMLADANALAERLRRVHRMPKLWLASDATITTRDDAEDFAEIAGDLARDLGAFVAAVEISPINGLFEGSALTVDFEVLSTLLKAIIRDRDVCDLSVVEAFLTPDNLVIAERFCEDMHDLTIAEAHLEKCLSSTGAEVDEKLSTARAFALENNNCISPDKISQEISEDEDLLAQKRREIQIVSDLPAEWAETSGMTVKALQRAARRITSFDNAVLSLRLADPGCQAAALSHELKTTIATLAAELKQIQETLPLANNHQPDQIQKAAADVSNAGMFRFMSGDFKAACALYCDSLGGATKVDRQLMAGHLNAYSTWLKKRQAFEADARFGAVFGDLFSGLSSDPVQISMAADFYDTIQDVAKDDRALQKTLEQDDLAPLVTLVALQEASDLTLSELREDIEILSDDIVAGNDALIASRHHLALFPGRSDIALHEIEEFIGNRARILSLENSLATSEIGGLLGDLYLGKETAIDTVERQVRLARAILDFEKVALAVSILRSADADSLLRTVMEIGERRNALTARAGEFCDSVHLPVDYRSLQFLFDQKFELEAASLDSDALLDRAQLKRSEDTLRRQGFTDLVDWAYSDLEDFDPIRLGRVMRAIIAKNMVDKAFTIHGSALRDYDGQDFDRIREEIVERDRELIRMSRKVIRQGLLRDARPPQGNGIGRKSTYTEMSLIINEMNKRRNRLGIRELTQRAGQALLELKPCWMMSPLAVAQYLHEGMEFDLVVIDEASQMTPENAIGALSRAGQAVVVGDTKQLPPTSFFRKMLDDDDIDEDLREDSESILDMANVAFMPIRQLRWHYRSRHSALIQFSNKMMYKEELTIFPSPREDDPDMGVHIVEVPGAYKSGRNEIEARAVVSAVVRHMTRHPDQSLGVCTMNSDQKDLIIDEFERERDRNKIVQDFVSKWEEENDSLEEFFIKNLETIQGDERDVMFISTLYGPETPGGKVLQRFGPINSVHGHRRLNVLFTRAKRKMVTFTSLRPADILVDDAKNYGVKMFRAWLEYCQSGHVPSTEAAGGETESPFETFVAQQIEALGCTVVPQVGVAGFRIDLGIKHPDWPYGYILGVECDGATYHSSRSSRDRDRLRQEVLEGLGWKLHRIWSTDWFRNPRTEIEVLKKVIDEALEKAKRQTPPKLTPVSTMKMIDDIVQNADRPISKKPVEDKSKPQRMVQEALQIGGSDDLFSHRVAAQKAAETFAPQVKTERIAIGTGSNVKVESLSDGGKKLSFKLIDGKNDPENGLVGIHSPLGAALLDAEVGESVEYQVGAYVREVKVLEIS